MRCAWLLSILLSAAACGGDDSPTGTPDDAATDLGRADGTVGDAGSTGQDAGGGADAVVPGDDVGPPPGTDAGPPPDVDAGPAPGCGPGPACAPPFSCSAGGYCVSATGVPAFDRVYVVVFENRSLTSVRGHAPYLDSLAASGASASQYISVTHPSLPNYLAMTSGDTGGVACDCHPGASADCNPVTCNLLLSACNCPQARDHLGNQLDALGVPWREYGEGMGTPCNATDSGRYAAKHLPFLYYPDVFGDPTRCAERVRDYGDLGADIAAGAYRFSMVSPDLCNDMHDTCGGDPVTHGDTWASTNLAPIIASPGFGPEGRDVLFVVWDEEDNSLGTAPIPFIVVSPLARPGAVTDQRYDHYSLLATWEDAFGAPRLGNAATAAPIADIWR